MDNAVTRAPHIVVVGGGISGLAAAHRLLGAGARVTVLEGSAVLGGKLLAGEIAGAPVDLGAESMLARRPEGVELARAVGLGDRLQAPATAAASIWTRGALRPMPKGHVMGVPARPGTLHDILSAEGLARVEQDRELAPTEVGEDIGVGEFVAKRVGREVVDRLVEPLLGGVYAGDAYKISMRAAVPQLFEAARTHGSLLDGVQDIQAKAAAKQQSGPVFAGLDGGLGTLPGAVADAVRAQGGEIRTETPVLGLTRSADGWQIRTDTELVEADGVILSTPPGPPPRCSPPSRRSRPPSSPRSSTPRWSWSRSRSGAPIWPGWRSAPGSWCRRWTAAPSRPPPSPRTSGSG